MKYLEKNQDLVALMKQIKAIPFKDSRSTLELCKKLEKEAKKYNSDFAMAFAKIFVSDYYAVTGEPKTAIKFINEGLEIAEKCNFTELLILGYILMGNSYFDLVDQQSAIDYYLKSLELSTKYNRYDYLLSSYNNIGNMFYEQKDSDKAITLFLKAEEYSSKLDIENDPKNIYTISIVYNNLCNAYLDKNNIEKSKYYLDKMTALNVEKESESLVFILIARAKIHYLENNINETIQILAEIIGILSSNDERSENIFEIFTELFDLLFKIDKQELIEQSLKIMKRIAGLEINVARNLVFHEYCIKYLERFNNNPQELLETYRSYHKLSEALRKNSQRNKVDSFEVKINLFNYTMEKNKIMQQQKRLKQMSVIDALCNIANRRGLRLELKKIIKRCIENNKKIAVIIFDIDYFKEYNDAHGHIQGDKALKVFSTILKKNSSKGFFPARFGGDEFVCVAYDKTDKDINAFIEGIRSQLHSSTGVNTENKDEITFSAGYTNQLITKDTSTHDLIERSDVALYFAKQNGRNRFVGNIDQLIQK